MSDGCLLSPPAASVFASACFCMHISGNCFKMLSLQRGYLSRVGDMGVAHCLPFTASHYCRHPPLAHACSMPVTTDCLQRELIAPPCCLAGKPQLLCAAVVLSCCCGAPCCFQFARPCLFQDLRAATAPSLWRCKLPWPPCRLPWDLMWSFQDPFEREAFKHLFPNMTATQKVWTCPISRPSLVDRLLGAATEVSSTAAPCRLRSSVACTQPSRHPRHCAAAEHASRLPPEGAAEA